MYVTLYERNDTPRGTHLRPLRILRNTRLRFGSRVQHTIWLDDEDWKKHAFAHLIPRVNRRLLVFARMREKECTTAFEDSDMT